MIVLPLSFIFTPRGVEKWLLPASGACLLYLEHFATVLPSLQPLCLIFSLAGRPQLYQRDTEEFRFRHRWIQITLPWTVVSGKGLKQVSPVWTPERQFEYFNCFLGSHNFVHSTLQRRERNFFASHIYTLCVFNSYILYITHISFRCTTPWNICEIKTLILSFKCNPLSIHSSIHSVHVSQVPTAHHCFPKSGNEVDEDKWVPQQLLLRSTGHPGNMG